MKKILAFLALISLFFVSFASAAHAEWWAKQANGDLYTNGGNGLGNTVIHIAGCVVNGVPGCTGGGSGGPVLQTNGTPNGSQALLNLVAGSNVTLTDNGSGSVTIAAAGGGGGLIGSTSTVGTETWLGSAAGDLGTASTVDTVFAGIGAGANATSAGNSVFLGTDAGSEANGAGNSIFIGSSAGSGAADATTSNFIGTDAGFEAAEASGSNFFGLSAGDSALNAANSIFIGNSAGANDTVDNTVSGTSILIGNNTSTGGFSNSIALGTIATNTRVNQFLVAPTYTDWQIAGVDYVMPSSLGAAGSVLTDVAGDGTLSWAPSVASPITIQNTSSLFSTGLAGTWTQPSFSSIYLGQNAGGGNTSNSNIFIGEDAGNVATNASDSTFIGNNSGFGATNAGDSTFIGFAAGAGATDASGSTFVGIGAGTSALNAANSIFIGFNTGSGVNAPLSVLIGSNISNESALGGIHIGANNVIIGQNISLANATANSINLGGVLFGKNTYATTTGNSSITAVSNGSIGIGVVPASITARLHIAAGTATAGTAPFKLTSGTNLTTAEAGAFEFNGTNLFFTPTGTIRKVIPTIVSGRSTAQTAAVASVVTQTVGAADASYEVSANVLVTTATAHSFTVTCTYTDEGNTSRTVTLNFSTIAGVISNAAITNVAGAVPYEGVPLQIRAKSGTTITLATTGTFTTVTYNVEGSITQLQ